MKKSSRLFFLLLIFFITRSAFGQTISATGTTWNASVTTITEAGSNYSSNITSAANQTTLTISVGLALLTNWKVFVKKQDATWNSNLTVWVRKTGDGTGILTPVLGTISPNGATSFIQLTATNQEIFTGFSNRFNVPIQYEIRGLSVLIPASSYSTSVIFTVIDI
ncbi:hypothetical protein [Runella sp.]|uniref:hypothetical protein n=1 Tax=Runella sp. TaxID=1960881 RepID=UPI003D11B9D2